MPQKKSPRERIDILLHRKGIAGSRERAQAIIMAGKVFVDGKRIDKAGYKVPSDADIEVKGGDIPYVSRGGLKIEGAIRYFGIEVTGKTVLDIGSSTGGFTDFMLQNGAAEITALDVGRGLLDYRLRTDPRIRIIEGVNARYLEPDDIGEQKDIILTDVAFISLALIIPRIPPLLKPDGIYIPLVKPQFEVGKDEVEQGGVIHSLEKHLAAIVKIIDCSKKYGLLCSGAVRSPIEGLKGNREYFLRLELSPSKMIDVIELKRVVFEELG